MPTVSHESNSELGLVTKNAGLTPPILVPKGWSTPFVHQISNLPFVSSSSFSPLFCGAPDKKKSIKLISTLINKFGGDDKFLCASFDPTNNRFNPKKYWRGPVWINLNWILYNGLKRYGSNEIAKRIKKDSIELIRREGFCEYFDPRKDISESEKIGYGGNNFSWTAALFIDFINEKINL